MDTMDFGSKGAASQGGVARAKSLTAEERSAIAKYAVEARWEKEGKLKEKVLKATHGSEDHPLTIGEIEIPCYVLENKTRILSQRGLQTGIGMNISGGAQRMLKLVQAIGRNPDEIKDLSARITHPIKFLPPHGGIPAHGYEATILVDLCDAILQSRKDGKLSSQQQHVADRCEVVLRGLAKVGIIALIDEATGYQYERPFRDLQEQLKKFLSASLVRYSSGFPADYLKQLCRLRAVELRPDMKLPPYFGHLTGDIVYKRVAPGLLRGLKDRRAERGKPGNKLYQWTSEDKGYPALMQHLGSVVTLMRLHTDYKAFKAQLDKLYPRYPDVPGLFDNPLDWAEPSMPG